MSYGVTESGFIPKPFSVILDELKMFAKQQFGEDIDLTENSRLLRFLEIVAKREDELWQLAEDVYYSAFIDYATGNSLDNVAALLGFTRRPAIKATGFVNFTRNSPATEDIIIPQGTIVATQDDIQFRTTQVAILKQGETTVEYVPIEAVEAGAKANVAAGTITKLVSVVGGIDSVTNPLPTEGGKDAESDAEFRWRIKITLRSKGKATLDAILSAVRAVEGVRSAKIIENDGDSEQNGLPPHSFKIIVHGGEDDKIAQAIFDAKPAGIKAWGDIAVTAYDIDGKPYVVRFSRPTTVDIYVRAEVTVSGEVNTTDVKKAVMDYINNLEIGQDVIVSKIIAAVLSVKNVEDCSVLVGTSYPPSSSNNISIGETEVAVTDENKIEVVVNG
ncbi:MAG: baseplate J/gp47 family protein [Archaeoglobaceae archaeon]